jgi:hypothetical protein
MSLLERISWIAKHPRRWVGALYYAGMQLNRQYYRATSRGKGDFQAEGWDNLIILDGCRYDLFQDLVDMDGHLEYRRSSGSSSSEMLNAAFVDSDYNFDDTVYVTANAWAYSLPEDTFHAIIGLLDDHWDETYETVMPETVVEETIRAYERFPDKRTVVHFMQPHYPFIGKTGQGIDHSGIRTKKDGEWVGEVERPVWWQLQYGLLDRETVMEAYRENLEIVLSHVERLIDELPGKTVITADHGNLTGEWIGPVPVRGFGHPSSCYAEGLVKVPWFVVDDERRETNGDSPIGLVGDLDGETVNDRLESLGYL